jgi:hypothetical protein
MKKSLYILMISLAMAAIGNSDIIGNAKLNHTTSYTVATVVNGKLTTVGSANTEYVNGTASIGAANVVTLPANQVFFLIEQK